MMTKFVAFLQNYIGHDAEHALKYLHSRANLLRYFVPFSIITQCKVHSMYCNSNLSNECVKNVYQQKTISQLKVN